MTEWDAQRAAWEERVRLFGVERAAGNASRRTPEERAEFDRIQRTAVLPAMREALPSRWWAGPLVALDFGCGLGRWSGWLASLCGTCIAVDPTRSILSAASADSPGADVRFVRMDAGRIPVRDSSIDLVFSCLVLNTLLSASMLESAVGEFGRVLRPGGLLFVIDLTSRPGPALGRWSLARSVEEYQAALAPVAPMRLVGEYPDGVETHSILAGRKQVTGEP